MANYPGTQASASPANHTEVLNELVAVQTNKDFPVPGDIGLIAYAADPYTVGSGSATLGVSGRQALTRLWIPTATITNILCAIRTAGATLTSGQNLACLINSSGTVVATTVDQTTAWGTTGLKTMALTGTYSATAGYYYVGLLSNGTTTPAYSIMPGDTSNGLIAGLNTSSTRLGYLDATTRTAFPASYTLSGLTAEAQPRWVAVS